MSKRIEKIAYSKIKNLNGIFITFYQEYEIEVINEFGTEGYTPLEKYTAIISKDKNLTKIIKEFSCENSMSSISDKVRESGITLAGKHV